uniref:Uncharacterized protein n=2 Tax=Cacopsylla melanoneura TaxID=428564 RepID=A0A8D8RDJ5_9HEMI
MTVPLHSSFLYLLCHFCHSQLVSYHFISYSIHPCHTTTPPQHSHLSNLQPFLMYFLQRPSLSTIQHGRSYNYLVNLSTHVHSSITKHTRHFLPIHPGRIYTMSNFAIQFSFTVNGRTQVSELVHSVEVNSVKMYRVSIFHTKVQLYSLGSIDLETLFFQSSPPLLQFLLNFTRTFSTQHYVISKQHAPRSFSSYAFCQYIHDNIKQIWAKGRPLVKPDFHWNFVCKSDTASNLGGCLLIHVLYYTDILLRGSCYSQTTPNLITRNTVISLLKVNKNKVQYLFFFKVFLEHLTYGKNSIHSASPRHKTKLIFRDTSFFP